MELGIAHSSRFQHNSTCNLINPLDATRGGNSLWLSSQMFLAGGRPCQLLASRGGRAPGRPKAAEAGEKTGGAPDGPGRVVVCAPSGALDMFVPAERSGTEARLRV